LIIISDLFPAPDSLSIAFHQELETSLRICKKVLKVLGGKWLNWIQKLKFLPGRLL